MSRFYWIRPDKASRHTGNIEAAHKWILSGVHCPQCGATWGNTAYQYPSVDLSELSERELFEEPRPEPFHEFSRLRELVRPFVPPGVSLHPGTSFGPLVGTASGTFGPFFFQNPWTLLVRREVLEQLQTEGVRGLMGCRPELRFRQKNPPELLELQVEPHGMLHPDCLPPDQEPACTLCGRHGFRRPEEPILEAASLPKDTDLFRLANFATMIVGSERFADAVRRLELGEIVFQALPLR